MAIAVLEQLDDNIGRHREIERHYAEVKSIFEDDALVFLDGFNNLDVSMTFFPLDPNNTYTLPPATNDIMSMIRQQQQLHGKGHSAGSKKTLYYCT